MNYIKEIKNIIYINKMSEPLKEDNDNTGIFKNMDLNSHNHEPSIRYPCSNNPLDNKQNEQYSQKTEINNILDTKKKLYYSNPYFKCK